MALPSDFDEMYADAARFGVIDESIDAIDKRAARAIGSMAAAVGTSTQMGAADWAGDVLRETKEAIHKEICAVDRSGLKSDYSKLLDQALTKDGISYVAGVVVQVVSAIHPGLAVSSVVLYLSIWLIKRGLNHWCTVPYPV